MAERGVDYDFGEHSMHESSDTTTSPQQVQYPPSHCEIPSGPSSTIQSLTSASTLDSKLDLSPDETAARKGLLRDSFFDNWKDDAGNEPLHSPEEMQKKDPLATQIWKLYSKTRSRLPNSERMENLTWRMMSMNLRRKEMERRGLVTHLSMREQQRGIGLSDNRCRLSTPASALSSALSSPSAPKPNPPSGIAQLRQSADQAAGQVEAMNLDDFIVPSSIGSPTGVSPSPSASEAFSSSSTTVSAIPINKKVQQLQQEQDPHVSRASAPVVPPTIKENDHEFDYVQRHVRKTSIDERRVRTCILLGNAIGRSFRIGTDFALATKAARRCLATSSTSQ